MRETIQIEQHEAFGPPAAGSLLLHLLVFGGMALAVYIHPHRGLEWGNNAPPGAIQANLVSSAPSIPLPQVAPPTPNVLATQLPSPAPAPPQKATVPMQEPKAIPIPVRQPKLKPAEKQHAASPEHAQPLNQQHRANFGEAAPTQLAHTPTSAPRSSNSPVSVTGGDFASRFPWYVDKITRMVSQNWYTQQIDASTRVGSQCSVTFTIGRDGTVSSIHVTGASPSPTLNRTAVEAVQRVGSFGALPSQYTGNNVSVEYTFTYDQPSH